jgi:hypothetical protein
VPTAPLLTPKTARFDPTRLNLIGSMYRSNNFAYVWHTSKLQTLEQLKTQDILLGTSGPGSGSYDLAMLSREVLGLKFKLVRGYEGSNQVNIAMERGMEPHRSRSSSACAQSWKRRRIDYPHRHASTEMVLRYFAPMIRQ